MNFSRLIAISTFIISSICGLPLALASITDGVIDPVDKHSWSENAGWMSFGEPSGNVHVKDSALSGHVWSLNFGWIDLNSATAGVKNDGLGNLSGQAWGENTGWIDFSGVSIDVNGYFHGFATGVNTGQISLNCLNTASCGGSDFKVRTDWRPRNVRPQCNNGIDDDGDGLIDFPADPGCTSIWDDDESDVSGGGGGGGVAGGSAVVYEKPLLDGSISESVDEDVQEDPLDCEIFYDDIDGHWAYRYIRELTCLKIVSGRSVYKFEPDDGATRAEITKIALLMNGFVPNDNVTPDFPDMDTTHWAYDVVGTGYAEGIIHGYGDGLFRPDQRVTRAELVKIFLLAAGYELPKLVSYSFSDVPEYAWYYPYVSYAFSLSIVEGYADGLFRPDQKVTRAEAAKIAYFMMKME